MPVVAQKILSLNMNNDKDQDALVPAICQCPVTSARIISMANSAALRGYGREPITSIKEAVQRIGLNAAYNSAFASALFTLKGNDRINPFDYNKLWKHSTEVKQVMQALAKTMPPTERPSPQNIALVALVHDIGFLAYSAIHPELAVILLDRINAGEDSSVVSKELFNISHDQLGADLLSSWGIPEEIVIAVKEHHHKIQPKTYKYQHNKAYVLCNLLLVADAMLMGSDNVYDPYSDIMTIERATNLLNIAEEDLLMTLTDLKNEGLTISYS